MASIKKEGTKHCMFCSKKINLKKDQFVLIGTYNRVQKPDDEQYFHFVCWVDYFNKCVLNKAKANVQKMQELAMGLFNNPMIKNILSQVQGSGNILSMLSLPIQVNERNPQDVLFDKVQEKLKNVGAKLGSSVSKNTFAVLVKDIDEDTGKAADARKLGVPLMTPQEFTAKYL